MIKKLACAYLSQMNNSVTYGYRPNQQCNVTALTIGASAHINPNWVDKSGREEQLISVITANGGSIYSPGDMAAGFNALYNADGVKDTFYAAFNIEKIVEEIDAGNPCIIHGYFTRSGHIVTVVGHDLDNKQLIIHDPYGEWFRTGYHVNNASNQTRGKDNVFRMTTIDELCNYDGIWTHVISKIT